MTGNAGTATSPLQFTGGYTDQESGFSYLVNRYYDPASGEFLNRDPLVGVTGQPYSYATDNPLNGVDRSGMAVTITDKGDLTEPTIWDYIGNPQLLQGLNPQNLIDALGGTPAGWTVSPAQSASAGKGPGWKLSNPNDGGYQIRWSPGSARADHPDTPYWVVSGGKLKDTARVENAGEWPDGPSEYINPRPPEGGDCLTSFQQQGNSGGGTAVGCGVDEFGSWWDGMFGGGDDPLLASTIIDTSPCDFRGLLI